jgi:oligoendopeptidase F
MAKPTFKSSWDLTLLLSSEDPTLIAQEQQRIENAVELFCKHWEKQTDYLRQPEYLKKAVDEYEKLQATTGIDGNIGYYFWLRSQVDQNDPQVKARFNQIDEFGNKMRNKIQFFELRISRIASKDQQKFLKDPLLKEYKHYLERLFVQSRYLLSEDQEKILNLKSASAYSNWVKMTSSFLAKEERVVLDEDNNKQNQNFSSILSLLSSQKRQVRDSANKAFNDILAKHAEVATEELNAIIGNKKVDDELRGADRPDLLRHISDDIETEVVDALVKAVSLGYNISARFYALKAKLLGVKRLKYHERNVELNGAEKEYTFEEAIPLVSKVLTQLDPLFGEIFDRFLQGGNIDVYPKKGKRSGAFCAYNLISQPTYLLLNHTNKLTDVLTLAHELGHGINDELMKQKQHALYFGTPTSTAEVASTFMEDFVLDEILKTADDNLRLSISMMKLNSDISSIFRQIACYTFEQELHRRYRQEGYLSKELIGEIFQKHMAAYMGEAVEHSHGSNNWWVYWNHIRSFFYVYSYASGLLISKTMQRKVKNDPSFINEVKQFLSAGLSASPKNIFLSLGIDITKSSFWDEGLQEIADHLTQTEELARSLNKI